MLRETGKPTGVGLRGCLWGWLTNAVVWVVVGMAA